MKKAGFNYFYELNNIEFFVDGVLVSKLKTPAQESDIAFEMEKIYEAAFKSGQKSAMDQVGKQ